MKVLAVIPARGGSKSVPKKNIKFLGDKPLIAYSIEAASNSEKLTEAIISTDDEKISEVSKEYGGKVPFIRPDNLATDTANAIPVIQHALKTMEDKNGITYDAVMMLQPTTPFRRALDIDKAISILEETGADSVISVNDVGGHHPARMKFIENEWLIDPPFCETYENQPRQELVPMYIRNGAIYLTKKEVLLSNSFKGKKSAALVMPTKLSINIDTMDDFRMAEWSLNHTLQKSE